MNLNDYTVCNYSLEAHGPQCPHELPHASIVFYLNYAMGNKFGFILVEDEAVLEKT